MVENVQNIVKQNALLQNLLKKNTKKNIPFYIFTWKQDKVLLKWIILPKMKMNLLTHVIPNLLDLLYSVKHRRRYFEEFWQPDRFGDHWLPIYGQIKHWDISQNIFFMFQFRRKAIRVCNCLGAEQWKCGSIFTTTTS